MIILLSLIFFWKKLEYYLKWREDMLEAVNFAWSFNFALGLMQKLLCKSLIENIYTNINT